MSIQRGAAPLIVAPPVVPLPDKMINYYDRQRVACTCDEKKMASMISGHTWNILNNREDHEVYLQHARNHDHYIDAKTGRNTSHWFEKKKRIDLDGDGVIDCVDSSNVEEAMVCPGTAGKEAAHLRSRQAKQLCQSTAPRDFPLYSARRGNMIVPPTPPPANDTLQRLVGQQGRMRDVHDRPTPRVVTRDQWTPRRGEPCGVPPPPGEGEMFRSLDQLRAESHFDVTSQNVAEAMPSRRPRSLGVTGPRSLLAGAAGMPAISGMAGMAQTASSIGGPSGGSALAGAMTARSTMQRDDLPPRPAQDRVSHSKKRIEPQISREVTGWPFHHQDKMKRDDAYFVKPVQQTGSSSVKYDIISGDRRNYWY